MPYSHREVEILTASQCSFAGGQILIPLDEEGSWEVGSNTSNQKAQGGQEQQDGQQPQVLPCNLLQPGTTIKISPMTRQFGGWHDSHYHPNLRLPLECPTNGGIVIMLEAQARECVAVALSPESNFVLGKTYVIHFGGSGNISTVIRRRLPSNEAVDVQFAGRVCSTERYISYWVCLASNGKLYVGIGKRPGERCVGRMDDVLYHQLRSPKDAVRYVGLSNSALGRQAKPLKVRNVVVTTVPESLKTTLQKLDAAIDSGDDHAFALVNVETDASHNYNNSGTSNNDETQRMMEEYQKECRKARARAKKFNLEYKEPSPQAFFQWSEAKKLRSNPQKGFITGMDITAPEEEEKKRARAARFGLIKDKRGREEDDENEGNNSAGDQNPQDVEGGGDNMGEEETLSVVQAWDNELLTRPHRKDPPRVLWASPPLLEEQGEMTDEEQDATFTPEKIHISAIDWAAFKQIRTDDIMAYFASYGPSYVEWLGELSCNILFQDKFSAARALQNLSQQLPSPPPEELTAQQTDDTIIPDLARMGWSLCQTPIRKQVNDRYGRRGTNARILMRVATSVDVLVEKPTRWPRPPPGFTTKRVLGPGSHVRQKKRRRKSYGQTAEIGFGEGNNDNNNNTGMFDPTSGEEHPALSRGLRSERGGYSIEELQAERAGADRNEGSMVGPPEVVTSS